MKYKVGDRVVVRSDLRIGTTYYMEDREDYDSLVDEMAKLMGCTVTITRAGSKYRIRECRFNWTDEMFAGLEDELETDVTYLI